MDYKKFGLKCGIEIHQQLEGKKLFCNCPTKLIDDRPDFTVQRKQRASAGETGEIIVKVTPNAGVAGTQSFTAKIKANGEVMKEINLNANVAVASGSDLGNVKRGLEIGFAILAILLVILGLIIASNKLKGSDDDEEPLAEGEQSAGQTYY